MTVSLIVPFYNAGKELERALHFCIKEKQKFPCDLEVIFVNDGSTNDGLRIAAQYEKAGITVLSYSQSRGLGYATRLGVQVATGEVIAITSVALPYGVEVVTDAIIALSEQETDIICGSRLAEGVKGLSPFKRLHILQQSWTINEYLKLRVRDALSCFYLLDGTVARKLFPFCVVDNAFYPLEFLGLAQKKEYKIMEIPVHNHSSQHIIRNELGSRKMLLDNLKKIKVRLRFDEFY